MLLRFKSIILKFIKNKLRIIINGRNLKFINLTNRFNLFFISEIDIIPKYIFIENKDNI